MKDLLLIAICSAACFSLFGQRIQRDPFNFRSQVEDQSEIKKGQSVDDKIKKNFFLRAEVNKTTCYVGESLMATFKAYSRLNANSRVLKRPALTGFSVLEMVDAYNNEPDIERWKGKSYYVHLIRKVQLFPLQAGTFYLDPAEIESDIYFNQQKTNTSGMRRFRDLFLNRYRGANDSLVMKKITLETPTVEVHVNPLPEEGQPDDFSGAVGNFSIDLQMPEKNISQNEPATVKLIVTGTGNFPLVTDPLITWPAGVHVSEPQVTESFNKYIYPLSGAKIFQYTLDTRDTGLFTIPAVSFSYFDPSDKKYKSDSTRPLQYIVAADGKKSSRKLNELIVKNKKQLPLQFLYFGLIALGIISWIIYNSRKSRKE